jgi:peptide/nickel transport system permease protein
VILFSVRRLLWAVATAVVASMVAFVLFWSIPHVDPSFWLGGGQRGTNESRAKAVEKYGLDDPLPEQYVRLMKRVVNGNLSCFYSCGNLRDAFVQALPVTLSVVGGAALISIVCGVALALLCVRHRDRWPDRVISAGAAVAYSLTSLVLSAVLWAFLAKKWQIFPEEGYVHLGDNPIQWAWHLLLPWIAAAVPFTGAYTQIVRATLLDAVDSDWARTARAKGLSEKRVMRRHVLRNSLIAPVNLWGLDLSHAIGGYALYVEVIFGVPGVGLLTSETLNGLDLPAIVATAIYLAIVVALFSAIVDIVVAWLDPRIRAAGLLT